ncbi:gamma-glutamylcyclotransferase family protein [Pararhodobacter sp. SW119]|uniref:gamma-glutamylcyclotransferase family protein n=1 Tax=Pararhodobacter sp. SW119 TaxID=2780075 RepID=UPI001FD790D0|nr:gamma-glutamylcyclotransferase family protein [Pararhodobacter sp. SW119]
MSDGDPMTRDPYFFGYGSLVNRATHAYAPAHRARLKGWRRAWRHTALRDGPFLTAVPCPRSEIEGLIAAVPGADWIALDAREEGYDRLALTDGLSVEAITGIETQIYAVPAQAEVAPEGAILLSYVDVVLQGYLLEFGLDGVRRFMDTTDGWDTPVRNDRAAPLYPRAQRLSAAETVMVDAEMARLGVTILG